jgi:glutamyl-tRNA reductase
MKIVLIGLNHRTAPVELRERVHFSPEQALQAAAQLREKGVLVEAVLLSTCNRSEVYGVPGATEVELSASVAQCISGFHGIAPGELNGSLYQHQGRAAIEHLFRVAAGLDSMLLGEAEVLGQVRDAYKVALEDGATGPVLNRVFQGALEVGKRVRSETALGAHAMSVASAAMKLAEQIFGNLGDKCALVIGAGATGTKAALQLRQREIGRLLVANRTPERTRELAARVGGECIAWENLESVLHQPDIVVTSVGGAEWSLTKAAVAGAMATRQNSPLFLIDLGVPRNIAGDVAGLYNVYLYNVDDLTGIVEQNRKSRAAEVPRAEAIVAEHLDKIAAWQAGAQAASVLSGLREKLHRERESFAAEYSAELEKFAPEDRERVVRLMDKLLEKIVHEPSARMLKEREVRDKLRDIELFRDLFGLGGGKR